MTEPYDVTRPGDRANGLRRYVDRTGREWTEPRPGLVTKSVARSDSDLPAGFRAVMLEAFTDGKSVLIPEQEELRLPDEVVYEGPGSHNCDDNGCGWGHILARFVLPLARDEGSDQ